MVLNKNTNITQLPKVSIGLPVYNGEKTLPRALNHILNQNHTNYELLISDNASTDKTETICRKYERNHPSIKYLKRDKNYGISNNFNFVAMQAKGEYFIWMHDDDYWAPEFLTTLVNELDSKPEIGLSMCAIQRVNNGGKKHDLIQFNQKDNPYYMTPFKLMNQIAGGWANKKRYHLFMFSMFRTQLFQAAGKYDDNDVPHPDRIFMCQFALATKFSYIDKILYFRTVHEKPMNLRHPNDVQNSMINHDPWGYSRTVLALGPFLFNSRIIPWYRKFYIPIGIFQMAWSYKWVLYRGDLNWYFKIPLNFTKLIVKNLKNILNQNLNHFKRQHKKN